MRTLIAALIGAILLVASPQASGQETAAPPAPRPKKVLTPAQQKLQKQMGELWAQQDVLRTQATQAFQAEMAREKAGDCPTANNTYEINVCLGKAVEATDQNFKTYEQALRGFLGLEYPTMPDSSAPSTAADKPALTPDLRLEEFDHYEQLWHDYAEAACLAVYHQYDGGTIAPSAKMGCQLRLVRNHLRELDANYETQLHH